MVQIQLQPSFWSCKGVWVLHFSSHGLVICRVLVQIHLHSCIMNFDHCNTAYQVSFSHNPDIKYNCSLIGQQFSYKISHSWKGHDAKDKSISLISKARVFSVWTSNYFNITLAYISRLLCSMGLPSHSVINLCTNPLAAQFKPITSNFKGQGRVCTSFSPATCRLA